MAAYPKSPNDAVGGMIYFARMLDKIRLHARGELPPEYHQNMGAQRSADGVCLNFLRINYDELKKRVAEYPLDRVAAITGVDADLIRAAARMYATSGPAVSVSGAANSAGTGMVVIQSVEKPSGGQRRCVCSRSTP